MPLTPDPHAGGAAPARRSAADVLRTETVGGLLLLVGAVAGLVWANSPASDAYLALRSVTVGPSALHLDLTLAQWAGDGLLAVFFFVVGLELKREIVAGDLRDPRRAAVPVLAAVGGMAVPALLYTAVNLQTGGDALRGWAIPTATDIAFAVAVLAVVGRHLPGVLRSFLLTLAVVDDLLAITVIAVFYTGDLAFAPLLAAGAVVAVFGVLVRRGVPGWLLLPIGVLAWALMHASGVHATVAGVLLGLTVPAVRRRPAEPSPAERLEHRWRPWSAGFVLPVFAFFAAGVSVTGAGGFGGVLRDPVAVGVVLGLVVGKVAGVLGTTFVVTRLTRARLDAEIRWPDLLGVGLLAGIGFTVSLLIGELAFGEASGRGDHVRAAILLGSLTSAVLAAAVLVPRDRHHRRLREGSDPGRSAPTPGRA